MNKLPNGNRVVFVHTRDPKNPRVGICHALEVNESNNVIAFGTAQCSPKDNYSRKIGRTISAGRLASPEIRRTIEEVPIKDAINACVKMASEKFELDHATEDVLAEIKATTKEAKRFRAGLLRVRGTLLIGEQ